MKELKKLEEIVSSRVTGYRLAHILSVRDECARIADLFHMTDGEKESLCIAALLHDITKMKKGEDQIRLAEKLGIGLTRDDLDSPAVLHSLTGAEVARQEFSDYTNDAICEAIAVHTTGKEGMSLMDKLLFLADYIEPLRTFEDCRQVRDFFYEGMDKASPSQRLSHLDQTLLLAFDLTIRGLLDEKQKIHPKTIISRNFLL